MFTKPSTIQLALLSMFKSTATCLELKRFRSNEPAQESSLAEPPRTDLRAGIWKRAHDCRFHPASFRQQRTACCMKIKSSNTHLQASPNTFTWGRMWLSSIFCKLSHGTAMYKTGLYEKNKQTLIQQLPGLCGHFHECSRLNRGSGGNESKHSLTLKQLRNERTQSGTRGSRPPKMGVVKGLRIGSIAS